MKYGLYLLNKNKNDIKIKASGNAISKAYIVAELIKRKIKGIH
jgi:DNA-binding protein